MSEETISLLGDTRADAGGADARINSSALAVGTEQAGPLEDDGPEEEPEPPSPDEVKQRRSLVRCIARYKAVFPAEVSELAAELEGLIHKSPEELAALLEEVQFLVETRRSTAQARGLFLAGLTMGEAAGPYVGLKLQGLTQVAAQSTDLLTTVDEVALKYEGVVQVDPMARLAMAVGQLCLAVDGVNRAREAGATKSDTQESPATKSDTQESPATKSTGIIKREEYFDL